MKPRVALGLAVLALAGCRHVTTETKSGTEVSTDGSGRTTVVDYVSQEEYQRMTPEERARMHAAVGASASWGWGGEKPSRPSASLNTKEVGQAAAAATPK